MILLVLAAWITESWMLVAAFYLFALRPLHPPSLPIFIFCQIHVERIYVFCNLSFPHKNSERSNGPAFDSRSALWYIGTNVSVDSSVVERSIAESFFYSLSFFYCSAYPPPILRSATTSLCCVPACSRYARTTKKRTTKRHIIITRRYPIAVATSDGINSWHI